MEYKNKRKLKEQNSSRSTEPKNGPTVTKGKGTGEDGWEGRDKGRKKRKGALQLAYILCGGTRRAVQLKASSDFTASYYGDGQCL